MVGLAAHKFLFFLKFEDHPRLRQEARGTAIPLREGPESRLDAQKIGGNFA